MSTEPAAGHVLPVTPPTSWPRSRVSKGVGDRRRPPWRRLLRADALLIVETGLGARSSGGTDVGRLAPGGQLLEARSAVGSDEPPELPSCEENALLRSAAGRSPKGNAHTSGTRRRVACDRRKDPESHLLPETAPGWEEAEAPRASGGRGSGWDRPPPAVTASLFFWARGALRRPCPP